MAPAAGSFLLGRRIAREVDQLFAASRDVRPSVLTEANLEGLPAPVGRWLRYAQIVGKERPMTVRLKQQGQFRLGPNKGWMPFQAEQYFTTEPPGFVWKVRMAIAPLVAVTGRDRYAAGEGSMRMCLLSLFPVADKAGGGLNQGDLLRYLGETIWFPSGALSPYITWEGLDATSARATMSYGGVMASATFHFDEQGRHVTTVAERYNDALGRLATWMAPTSAYGEFDGVRVGVAGEGLWKYDTGDFPYIRWRITALEYNRPERY
jgi:hypothetical protein